MDVDQLRSWDLVAAFRARVLPLLARRTPHPSEADARRTLGLLDYLSVFVLAMFNPAVTSLRALAHASHCQKMRQVTSAPFSIASFSAAQHLWEPELLGQVLRQVAREAQAKGLGPAGDPRVREALAGLTAVDGTILRGVERMAWAPAAGPGQAVRLHLHFSVFDQVPEAWTITPANASERKVLRQNLRAGACYVADRGYGNEYALLETVRQAGAHFVFRLPNDCIQALLTERPLSAADRAAGVVGDRIVRLGVHGQGPVVRVVRVEAGGHVFHLATSREDLPAELIGLIYRQRWQIELFFKWIKTILNCRHWFAQSPSGVATQLYATLLCSLLLMLWSGRRPNLREVESLRLYQSGFATEQELELLLRRARPRPKPPKN